jgi:hypothetical protein
MRVCDGSSHQGGWWLPPALFPSPSPSRVTPLSRSHLRREGLDADYRRSDQTHNGLVSVTRRRDDWVSAGSRDHERPPQ